MEELKEMKEREETEKVREGINVFLVEDEFFWLEGLSAFLEKEKDIHIVATATNGREAIEHVERCHADVVLMDIILPGNMNGLEAGQKIKEKCDIKLIMLTSLGEVETICHSYEAGAVDYILKTNFEDIPRAIRQAYYGNPPIREEISACIRNELVDLRRMRREHEQLKFKRQFTQAEFDILMLFNEGKTQKQIAYELFLSTHTVKNHTTSILRKSGEKKIKLLLIEARKLGVF